MLVQARGMLVAVRLVPTPSLPVLSPPSSVLPPFLHRSSPPGGSDFEYRSGLLGLMCGCVAVVELTAPLTRVASLFTHAPTPRGDGTVTETPTGRERVRAYQHHAAPRRLLFLCVSAYGMLYAVCRM